MEKSHFDWATFWGARQVMGVFLGDRKNSNAAICAVNIAWAVTECIRPKFEAAYDVFKNGTYKINHCTGIDGSEVLVVRAGIRNNNDLVWVGRAPNVAAKLSSNREDLDFMTYITADVYGWLNEEAKFTVKPENFHQEMWQPHSGSVLYRSYWYRSPTL
jgi:adenylate cyclase